MKSPLNRGGLRFYLVAIGLVCGVLLFDRTSARSILAGLPCLLVGAWLHTWAKGCLRQDRAVATGGPYRFVRHPFYLANALIDAGLAMMSGWWPLMIALPWWWLAIYLPVIRREENHLGEKFPDEYSIYRRQVPRLLPWRRPLPASGDGFRWSNPNIAGGEELPRVVRIVAYPLLFFVAQGIRGGLPWLGDGWNLTALSGLIILYVLAWEVQRHQRQGLPILPAIMRGPALRVVVGGAVLAAVCYVSGPRTALGNYVSTAGAVLLLLSVPIYSRRGARGAAAECVALLGALAAGELLWLAPPLAAIYVAWMLDRQLPAAQSTKGQDEAALPPYSWPFLYPVLATAGAVIIGVKLIGHGLPYHLVVF